MAFGYCEWGNYLGQIPEADDERPKSVTDPTTTLLHYISITTLDLILDIKLIMESGGPPVQRADEVLAGAGSKGKRQNVRCGKVGDRVSKALGRLVCRKAEADRVVSVTRV